jgi:glycyl-tRNA synthetase
MQELLAQDTEIRAKITSIKAVANFDKAEVEVLAAQLKKVKEAIAALNEADGAERKQIAKFRAELDDLLQRRFFVVPSNEIYGGTAGLYDYGPPGCALMSNLQSVWRSHFVLTEAMLEVSCTSMTPEVVLKASGHVDRFTDYMVQDTVTNEYHRADKLLEERCEQLAAEDTKADPAWTDAIAIAAAKAGSMNKEELEAAIKQFGVTAEGHPVSDVTTFNLMFKTSIGPTGKSVGYLRPETAQGIFVNFRRLYEYNNRRLPFAAAQIGLAYRNEIAPRAGLLRVREFPLAEIEHFVNPSDKSHVSFASVRDYELVLLSQAGQEDGRNTTRTVTVGAAVAEGVIDNETLGYFMARTHMFLRAVGIDGERLRFRQHMKTEMAHYAKDCWDAEIKTSYGWIECVGHADRSAYDLKVHSDCSKANLSANETLEKPIVVKKLTAVPNRGALGKRLGGQAPVLFAALAAMEEAPLKAIADELATAGQATVALEAGAVTVTKDELTVAEREQKVSTVSYLPSVIEPSFGLGRIIYSMLEHAMYARPDDEQRKVLRLTPLVAPVKIGLYNVTSSIAYQPVFAAIKAAAIRAGLTYNEDTSKASIGRKYSRGDEIGIPFAVTVDPESCDPAKAVVTIRERDSMTQIQVKIPEAVEIVRGIVSGDLTWEAAYEKYPKFNFVDNDK